MKSIVGKESFDEAISSDKVVFVKFTADWCAQCKMMEAIIRQVIEQFRDNVVFISLDVDAPGNREIIKNNNIMTLPTCIIYKDRIQKERFGMVAKAAIVNKLENLLN
jgi:thioredoxin 1